jgi:glycosyltransferase involved in cell wall biosynthesis
MRLPASRADTSVTMPAPRIALVHDWLTGMRGGEKVLEVLCELYPTASLFTLVHVPGSVSATIERLRPRASALQWLPGIRRYYRHCLPLFPVAIEQFDLDDYDLVISTSHCAAKAIVKTGRALHLCYCFTPMRYAWDQFDAYFGPQRVGPVAGRLLRPMLAGLARWDAATAGRVDRFVAISEHVAGRIRRYYNRGAVVVYPPVDTAFYHPDETAPDSSMLIVSALVPYKRIDLAVEASRQARVRLRVVGEGPERQRLERLAGPNVEFLGVRTDEEIRVLYRQAAAVVLPGEEDFGIAPLEAQACGRPVVALARGGALETVVDGVTGILVGDPSAAALADGMIRAQRASFDTQVIRQHALRFARAKFAAAFQSCVADLLSAPPEGSGIHGQAA